MIRRRRHVEAQQPLGPEDDPYLAYLAWREERDAGKAEQVEPALAAVPDRPSWIRRLATWRRDDGPGS